LLRSSCSFCYLGCIFLFSGIYFWTKKTVPARIPEDFFFSCVIQRNFSQERGFGGGLRNSCFLPLSQDFLAGIPAGQEFLHLQQIPLDSSRFLFPPNAVWLWPATKVGFLLSKYQLKYNFYLAAPPQHGWTMASTAPALAPLLPSRRSCCHSIAANTNVPDDDDVHDDGVGMVVVVVAESGTIAFVPVDGCPPCLVDNHYPVAVPLPSLI
jgi:hypothetical protein